MITVRLATLQDTRAICEIHQSDVAAWERFDVFGNVERVRYEDLTLYERWLHGGPWLSIETCAVHLNRLLAGAGYPLVAELDGKVVAEAEVYENFEAAPFGHHLSIGILYTHRDFTSQGLGTALVDYIREIARPMGCKQITVGDPATVEFYVGQGFQKTHSSRRVRIPTQAGRTFYQASDLTDPSPEQIKGWHMPLGRYGGAFQEWLSLFPGEWAAGIPELINIRMAHLRINAAGQNAIVYLREANDADSQPGECAVSCWSSRPLSGPLLAAIRDRAYRDGFRAILTYADDADAPLLEAADATPMEHRQDFYTLDLTS